MNYTPYVRSHTSDAGRRTSKAQAQEPLYVHTYNRTILHVYSYPISHRLMGSSGNGNVNATTTEYRVVALGNKSRETKTIVRGLVNLDQAIRACKDYNPKWGLLK